MTPLTFVIPGRPEFQGSKTRNRFGGGFHEDNPRLMSWRRDALAAADAARTEYDAPDRRGPTFVAPVRVVMRAYFLRPAGHYGTGRNAGVLKASAPLYVCTKPDTDKVQRALGDVLEQSGVVKGDHLIVWWDAAKLYSDHARVEVAVTEVRASVGPTIELPPLDAAPQEALI